LREVADASQRWIDELRPWTWSADRARPFTAWAVLVIGSVLASPRAMRRSWPLAGIALASLAAGFAVYRQQVAATMVSFPCVVCALSLLEERGGVRVARGIAIVAGLGGVLFLGIDWRGYAPGTGTIAAAVPIRAVALAQTLHLEGPVLNTSWYGGYIHWVRGEAHPPLVDTRNLGGPAFQSRFLRASTDPFAFDSLEAMYPFTHAIVQPPGDTPDRLALQLAARPQWSLIFADDAGLLFVRRDREPSIAESLGFRLFTPDYSVLSERCRAATRDSTLERVLRAELERARASSPLHARATMWLALLDLAEGRVAAALGLFDEVERIAPLTPGLALRLGMAREMAGDRPGARAAYRRASKEPADSAAAVEALRRLE
jgi:hypothetical protein